MGQQFWPKMWYHELRLWLSSSHRKSFQREGCLGPLDPWVWSETRGAGKPPHVFPVSSHSQEDLAGRPSPKLLPRFSTSAWEGDTHATLHVYVCCGPHPQSGTECRWSPSFQWPSAPGGAVQTAEELLKQFCCPGPRQPHQIGLSGDGAWEPVFLASLHEFMPYTD